MIRSALSFRRCARALGTPLRFTFKRGSTSYASGLGPGPSNEQAAAATLQSAPRYAQSPFNQQDQEMGPSPVASPCAERCFLAMARSRAVSESLEAGGLTVEEYHALIETGFLDDISAELIRGRLLAMPPHSIEHTGTASFLFRALYDALKDCAAVRKADPISLIKSKSEPEPDIFIASGVNDDYNIRKAVPSDILLIIEVSKCTIVKDSTIKLEDYASEGIPEYWIVNVNTRNVQVLRKPRGNCYESKETFSSGFIAPAAFPDIRVRVKDLFRS